MMQKCKTLYVSDLDGTLLNSDSKISAESVAMLNKAISAGANFTVATARTPATISLLLKDVDMKLDAISMTGATLWNCKTGKYSGGKFIHPQTVKNLLTQYAEHSLPVFIYVMSDKKIEVLHQGKLSALEQKFMQERSLTPFKQFDIPDSGYSKLPDTLDKVLLLYSMQPSAEVEKFYSLIKDDASINPIFYHDIFGQETGLLEVFSAATSKAAAVEKMAKQIGATRIVVFGDNLNDIPMMKIATHAVAVGNAVEEVRRCADEIIADNNSDAVARRILDDFRQNNKIISDSER